MVFMVLVFNITIKTMITKLLLGNIRRTCCVTHTRWRRFVITFLRTNTTVTCNQRYNTERLIKQKLIQVIGYCISHALVTSH